MGYIVKPFQDKELRNAVEIALYRHKMEKKLRESEERFNAIATAAMDAIILLDDHGKISYWNPASEKIFGYKHQEALNNEMHKLIVPEKYHNAFKKGLHEFKTAKKGDFSGKTVEFTAIKKDGTTFPVEISISGIRLKERWHAVGIIRDISERVKFSEELRVMAVTDELTGINNRRGFFALAEQQLKIARRKKREIRLFFVDLDELKKINDSFGHKEGDLAIIDTASVLKETFRESDIIARLGGDEFGVFVTEVSELTDEKIISARLQASLDRSNKNKNRPYNLSLSLGSAQCNHKDRCSIDELLTRADALMYENKQNKADN